MKLRTIILFALSLSLIGSSAHAQSIAQLNRRLIQLKRTVDSLVNRAQIAGPQGTQGPMGPQGPVGPAGTSGLNPIPSGQTVYGVLGDNVTGNFFEAYASLPAPAAVALDSASIIIRATPELIAACGGSTSCLSPNEQANQAFCGGTSTFPNPSPGFLCIYPTSVYASSAIITGSVDGLAVMTDNGSGSKYGFFASFFSDSAGLNFMQAVWAYKAP